MKRVFIKTLMAMVALAAAGVASAQDKTIKFANQNAAGHPIVLGMEKFKEIVEKNSGGKIKVNVFPGGALGSDQANVSAIQGGSLEMAAMNSGIFAAQVKEFAIFDFPFMFGSGKEADAVVDGAFGKKLHAKLEEKGLIGLGYYELGFRNITNSKRAINKLEDLEGLKLRVIPNPINVDWVKALGANPTPLPFPELYAALDQKAVDGQENPVATINGDKLLWDVVSCPATLLFLLDLASTWWSLTCSRCGHSVLFFCSSKLSRTRLINSNAELIFDMSYPPVV
jgi:tripartite ATP-independent transporter DctP family solute receptor